MSSSPPDILAFTSTTLVCDSGSVASDSVCGNAKSKHPATILINLSSPPSTVNISLILGDVDVRYARCWRELVSGRVASGLSMAVDV